MSSALPSSGSAPDRAYDWGLGFPDTGNGQGVNEMPMEPGAPGPRAELPGTAPDRIDRPNEYQIADSVLPQDVDGRPPRADYYPNQPAGEPTKGPPTLPNYEQPVELPDYGGGNAWGNYRVERVDDNRRSYPTTSPDPKAHQPRRATEPMMHERVAEMNVRLRRIANEVRGLGDLFAGQSRVEQLVGRFQAISREAASITGEVIPSAQPTRAQAMQVRLAALAREAADLVERGF